MGTLTRYLLRAHLGPFLFAFTALTSLLFLNAVAQRLEDLVGKGLSWDVILEFVVLSLPHTVALTLPMAVLVAVLYTFSDLTANNEVTAMSAGGVKPSRILLPMVTAGLVLTLGMLYFNDRILPEANHRLKNLMVDVGNKSPTFELREQVVNEISTGDGSSRYYLQTNRIDRQRNMLYDVAIYDVSGRSGHQTTYADSGSMAFNEAGTDLYLTLYDGIVLESTEDDRGQFRRVEFAEQVVPLRGVGDVLERQTGGGQRSDREMSIAMLTESAREREARRAELLEEIRHESRTAVQRALGMSPASDGEATDGTESEGGEEADGGEADGGAEEEASAGPGEEAEPAELPAAGPASRAAQSSRAESIPPDELTEDTQANIRTRASQAEALELAANRYRVEIHKKYTIAFACFVFVLIGAPIAVRFPRGGVGMTIAVSVGVFGIYWMGLIGGEKLADQGVVTPFVSMWITNIIFFVIGALMSLRLGRWIATARGGGWDDLLITLKGVLGRPLELLRGEDASREPAGEAG